jgi:hypothetical protein
MAVPICEAIIMTPKIRDMAAEIYTRFAVRDVVQTSHTEPIKPDAESLARLSFLLANAFAKIEAELSGVVDPNAPKFDFSKVDLT